MTAKKKKKKREYKVTIQYESIIQETVTIMAKSPEMAEREVQKREWDLGDTKIVKWQTADDTATIQVIKVEEAKPTSQK